MTINLLFDERDTRGWLGGREFFFKNDETRDFPRNLRYCDSLEMPFILLYFVVQFHPEEASSVESFAIRGRRITTAVDPLLSLLLTNNLRPVTDGRGEAIYQIVATKEQKDLPFVVEEEEAEDAPLFGRRIKSGGDRKRVGG